MYDQIREDPLYIMLYAVVITMAMMASCYLLFRRANAIAPDVTPPLRLRRWTAALFASLALGHMWYMPLFFLTSPEDVRSYDLVGGLLDSMTVIPLEIAVLFVMLQDRQRPLWIIVVSAFSAATLSYDLLLGLYVYSLLMCMGLMIYMVRALRQYGRWLRENYADLEHKEVWQSFVVLAIIMLAFVIYAFTSEGVVYQYAMQLIIIVLICYLLWRVETLSDLSISQQQSQMAAELATVESEDADHDELPQTLRDKIRTSLQQHCIDTQLYLQHDLTISQLAQAIGTLYLQHDLTISQLAQAIGTNRTYLSQYFSSQGLTYNAYINDLRINHFVSLYRENVAAQRSFTVYQLAKESGYSSYSTFCGIIKRKTGQSVTAWMKDIAPDLELREGLREP